MHGAFTRGGRAVAHFGRWVGRAVAHFGKWVGRALRSSACNDGARVAHRARFAVVNALSQALRDVAGQLTRPSGRAAWRQDLRMLPRALRWALPWSLLGRLSRDANPVRWLERHARARPSDLVLATNEQQWSFAELRDAVQQRARQLAQRGVCPGCRVAIALPTEPALVISVLACWQLGAVACPLDPTAHASTISEILEGLEPAWIIVDDAASAKLGPGSRQIRVDPQEVRAGTLPAVDPPTAHVRMAARAVAMILPTSGTEGSLKLCRVTAGRLALAGHAMGALALECRRGDVIYCPLPMHHATGITVALLPALVHGVALYLPGKFSASTFWAEVASSGATQLIYVGDLLRIILARMPAHGAAPPRLRRLVGNGLDAPTAETVARVFTPCRIIEFYGATEAPSLLLNYHGQLGAIGRVPGRAWSRFAVVRDAAPDRTFVASNATSSHASVAVETYPPRWIHCAAGEVGELWIRIPRGKRPFLGDFEGYLDRRDDERAVIENAFRPGDRYYRTRDLVRYDADDFFYFVDRAGAVWRSNGHNVSTTWLAARLREAPGIEDAYATTVAIDDSSLRIGLGVVVTNRPDWRSGYEAIVAGLPRYARPQLVQVLSELPRTATWKTPNSGKRPWWQPQQDSLALYLWNDGLVDVSSSDWNTVRAALLGE